MTDSYDEALEGDILSAEEKVIGAARRVFVLLSALDITVPMSVVGSLIELRDALAEYDDDPDDLDKSIARRNKA